MDEKYNNAAENVSREGSEKEGMRFDGMNKTVVNESGVPIDVDEHRSYTREEEKRVVRKMDTTILPLVRSSRFVCTRKSLSAQLVASNSFHQTSFYNISLSAMIYSQLIL